jgi:hypothetical protein
MPADPNHAHRPTLREPDMHSTTNPPTGLFSRHSRRTWLRAGGLSLLGLSTADLARLRAAPASSCIFLFLFGGPSQIDLWDMKPRAPVEVRGEFQPIATSVPGVQVCEHLPRFARVLDKVCLLRSMTHRMNVHGPACSEIFTGREYFGPPTTDQARPEDWPSLSSLVMRYGSSDRGLPPSVVLPWYLQFPGQGKRIAGQTGGRMGEHYNPFLVQGEIEKPDFEIEGIRLSDEVSVARLNERRDLLGRLQSHAPAGPSVETFEGNCRKVYELLSHQAGIGFDLGREPDAVRDRYGRTAVGQSLLLARRLVEAGVGLVTVNWQDETKIDGVNTCWDTHQNNFSKLTNLLCPTFDQAFPAFIDDLAERGLLDTTLVVALGEFGRTPKMGQFTQSSNTQKSGRDHWPHAFTAIVAGGGIRGGQVYGATNRDAGYVADKPVSPADLSATILHHLGIDFTRQYEDDFQHLRNRLSDGRVVDDLT